MLWTRANLRQKDFVSIRVGQWFEARGGGWGVIALPILVFVFGALAGLRLMALS
jgi:hypothetical protein